MSDRILEQYLETIRMAPTNLDHAVDTMRRKLDEARAESKRLAEEYGTQDWYGRGVTPDGWLKDTEAKIRAELESDIDQTIAEVREARDELEQRLAARTRKKGDPIEALLDAEGERRAWERAERQLDAGVGHGELITRAGAQGDVATLRAIRAELPAWLETQARKANNGQDPRPEDRTATTTRAMDNIDRAILPHVPKDQQPALRARLELPGRMTAFEAKAVAAMSARRSQSTFSPSTAIAAAYASASADREAESIGAGVDD